MTNLKHNLSVSWHCMSITLRQQAIYSLVPANFASDKERDGFFMEKYKMDKMINNIVKELKRKEDIRIFYRLAAKYGFYEGNPIVTRTIKRKPCSLCN
jgi:hypothetical protein